MLLLLLLLLLLLGLNFVLAAAEAAGP